MLAFADSDRTVQIQAPEYLWHAKYLWHAISAAHPFFELPFVCLDFRTSWVMQGTSVVRFALKSPMTGVHTTIVQ